MYLTKNQKEQIENNGTLLCTVLEEDIGAETLSTEYYQYNDKYFAVKTYSLGSYVDEWEEITAEDLPEYEEIGEEIDAR